MNKRDRLIINYLPSLIVCHRAALNMIAIYREILGEFILNHKDYDIKNIKNENNICNIFCKIADVPDAFEVMNDLFREMVLEGGFNNEYDKRLYFERFVNKIYTVLYVNNFKYNPSDPTYLPRGDIQLMQDRDILLNSVLRNEQEKYNKLGYKSIENYSFKPFTMDEINGEEGDSLLSKLDEIVHWVDNNN